MEQGRALSDCKVRPSPWWHAHLLSQLRTCKEWGFRPSEFGLCDKERDLDLMMAADLALGHMEAYEFEQAQKEAERKSRMKKGR